MRRAVASTNLLIYSSTMTSDYDQATDCVISSRARNCGSSISSCAMAGETLLACDKARAADLLLCAVGGGRTRTERKIFFYFNGNLGSDYNGRPEAQYSMRIRQRVAEEFASVPNKDGKLGRQHQEDVIVTHNRSPDYHTDLANSTFCGVFPGDGWSARMEASVLHGCIPVIIQDGIFLPYENVLDFENFAIRILEDDIPNMIEILKRIDEAKIESMMNNVRSIASRFRYRDSVLLEAERQKVLFGDEKPEWAVEYSKLEGDDVFSTFIQILHYKLYNDPWRRDTAEKQESSGLPKGCLK